MLKVSNRKCIRRLSDRSLKAAKTRNIIAVLAIALTTVLFTSLFTIGASINYSFQQQNFRQAGGDMHATFKNLTEEQLLELQDDPLAKESGARLFVGMTGDEPPFNKSHVEISYMDESEAKHYFIEPAEGSLPREGTDEAATDTRVLALLGVEPKVGAKFTIPVGIDENTQDAQYIERTFTLSGWWEYDSAIVASNVLLPRSAAEDLCALSAGDPQSQTGKWHLDMMFSSAFGIRENAEQVLANHGYQCDDPNADNYIAIGVNWGYSAAQIDATADPMTILALAAMLLLIMFTGYLIIYNVFQISVTNDIRFYGLLKTIGTTGKQIRRMIRRHAFLLSLAGIPLGWVVGFVVGVWLTPIIMAQTSYTNAFVSFNPLIFIGSAIFSLLTVRISCHRPAKWPRASPPSKPCATPMRVYARAGYIEANMPIKSIPERACRAWHGQTSAAAAAKRPSQLFRSRSRLCSCR